MTPKKSKLVPVDLSLVHRYSISDRVHKTLTSGFSKPIKKNARISDFLKSLPEFLKGKDFNSFISEITKARNKGKPFHLLLGAHTIKVGLSPIIIDLMKRDVVTGISFNGAGMIHDLELAFFGGTSEDVQAGLSDGSFGMVEETSQLCSEVAALAQAERIGLGEACGKFINQQKAKYKKQSLFATAQSLNLPATIHAGIGTDIIAQHREFDGAAYGEASHYDFRLLSAICKDIDNGGVLANIGSAVILPEVFLKALTVARNIKNGKSRLVTANFDMIEHYRPRVNIVTRPTLNVGRGFNFVGHHEIMIPLLAWAVRDALDC